MRNRRSASVAANPVLIGAATTLIVLVAVFLAYNANNGLPFVPTYQLKAEFPNAANVVKGNDVRIGGARVGVVSEIVPKRHRNGSVTAVMTLKLQTSVKPLPKDSTLLIRSRSALGLKYVEITRGATRVNGKKVPGYADGDPIPLRFARPAPVEIDQVFNTFDKPTRTAAANGLDDIGTALAGRGGDINLAINAFGPLLDNAIPVGQTLADPTTALGNLIRQLETTMSILAPVAETQASMFRNFDTTFGALAAVARPYIQETITNANPALDAAIRGFPVQRPFLENTTGLFRDLRPGVRALRGAAPPLADALEVGTGTLRRSNALNVRLQQALAALNGFSRDPQVPLGLGRLIDTARSINPLLAYLTPVQTNCNYASLWFRNVSSLLSEGDNNGTWQRFTIIATPQGPNNEGGPSSAPANGPTADNHLHANPYPNFGGPGQPNECEAANETYTKGKTVIGNEPGNQGTLHDVTTIDRSR